MDGIVNREAVMPYTTLTQCGDSKDAYKSSFSIQVFSNKLNLLTSEKLSRNMKKEVFDKFQAYSTALIQILISHFPRYCILQTLFLLGCTLYDFRKILF